MPPKGPSGPQCSQTPTLGSRQIPADRSGPARTLTGAVRSLTRPFRSRIPAAHRGLSFGAQSGGAPRRAQRGGRRSRPPSGFLLGTEPSRPTPRFPFAVAAPKRSPIPLPPPRGRPGPTPGLPRPSGAPSPGRGGDEGAAKMAAGPRDRAAPTPRPPRPTHSAARRLSAAAAAAPPAPRRGRQ